jgi:hypothetical protein
MLMWSTAAARWLRTMGDGCVLQCGHSNHIEPHFTQLVLACQHMCCNTADTARLQVLLALSNPGHPGLTTQLRVAAAAITARKHKDLGRWLEGGLITHVLAILRSLATLNLHPAEACDTCAACAAVICNILRLLHTSRCQVHVPPGFTPEALAEQVLSLDVLDAVVQFGMLPPAALEPLAPGRQIHFERTPPSTPEGTSGLSNTPCYKDFWTPLRMCSHLLAGALLEDNEVYAARFGGVAPRINSAVGRLVDTRVFRHLLETALMKAGGTCPSCMSMRT